jgi:hypothetical protein
MKIKVYSKAISFTSTLLNLCVKVHWWNMVKTLTEFRKNRLASPLREMLKLSN